jgi:hypothetical protein
VLRRLNASRVRAQAFDEAVIQQQSRTRGPTREGRTMPCITSFKCRNTAPRHPRRDLSVDPPPPPRGGGGGGGGPPPPPPARLRNSKGISAFTIRVHRRLSPHKNDPTRNASRREQRQGQDQDERQRDTKKRYPLSDRDRRLVGRTPPIFIK